jgi:Helix-turn-helix
MTVRFEKTARGEVAILPRREYEALVVQANEALEDAGTVRLVASARDEIAAGVPLLPKNVVDRLADGENAVRVIREWRACTQLSLSHKTGIGQGHISDIENGRRVGTPGALRRIADALNVPLDLLA